MSVCVYATYLIDVFRRTFVSGFVGVVSPRVENYVLSARRHRERREMEVKGKIHSTCNTSSHHLLPYSHAHNYVHTE